jgi:hypothetical protein
MTGINDAAQIAEILELRPLPEFKIQGDLLRYIERTRRQLDRFDSLPKSHGQRLAPDAETRIRQMCDELEADILAELAED